MSGRRPMPRRLSTNSEADAYRRRRAIYALKNGTPREIICRVHGISPAALRAIIEEEGLDVSKLSKAGHRWIGPVP